MTDYTKYGIFLNGETFKEIDFVGSSRRDLKAFPKEMTWRIGCALQKAQQGFKAYTAKPLKGFGGARVLEIVENFRGDAYRAVYTTRFDKVVYVLHCFQKKSKHGIKTDKHDIDVIRQRLKDAERGYRATYA